MESEEHVLTKQRRIAELARIHPQVSFASLAHHMDLEWLYEAYCRTRKDAAVGGGQAEQPAVREAAWGEPQGPAGTGEVRKLLGPTGEARTHSQGHGQRDPTHRDTDL